MATIRESVQEELVIIVAPRKSPLRSSLSGRISDALAHVADRLSAKHECSLSPAEKAAIECERGLEVSWVPTPTPEAHKAALVLTYGETHRRGLGFRRPDTGEWVPGIKLLTLKHGEANSDLVWSPWMPMDDGTISRIPEELGVYRIRAVSAESVAPIVPAAQSSECEPRQQEQEERVSTENTTRLSVEDFIPRVPEWRDKYVEGNVCAFKVEAFVQRNWGSPCLESGLCRGNFRRVEDIIEKLKGKNDAIKPEHDIEVVYRWGGGFGPMLFAKIMNSNPKHEVRSQIEAAFAALGEGDSVEAMERLRVLKGVNYPFGSKVLAMRSPWNAPIWDNIAQHCLREFRISGKKVRSYEQFIAFCEHIADELKRLGKPAPRGERWYLRDIEMALFQFGWDNGKFNGRITGELP